jgi:drug/metabolite transporter (DMT)-like permease
MTAIAFSISNVFIKMGFLLNGSDHCTILFLINFLFMLIVVVKNKKSIWGPKESRVLLSVRSLIGLLGVLCFYFGILFIPPSDCSSLSHTSIVITAILSRIFLKEKLSISHVFALILTMIGVLFISKPEFLFSSDSGETVLKINDTFKTVNSTHADLSKSPLHLNETTKIIIGIILTISAAFFFGLVSILIKKLCNNNVHWSVNTIYASYTGIPVCIIISLIFYFTEFSHTDLKSELPDLPLHILYSSCSAIFGILGQVFFNISLTCEDPTKVSIAKTSDVFFSYILQLFILNISVDFLSIIGSISILFGTFIVLSFKILENKLKKSPKSSCFKKVLFYNF